MEEKIRHLLTSVVHPETGQDIVGSGFIEHIAPEPARSPSYSVSPRPATRSR